MPAKPAKPFAVPAAKTPRLSIGVVAPRQLVAPRQRPCGENTMPVEGFVAPAAKTPRLSIGLVAPRQLAGALWRKHYAC